MNRHLQTLTAYTISFVLSCSLFAACAKKVSQERPSEIITHARTQIFGSDGKPIRIATLDSGNPIALADGEWCRIGETKYVGLAPAGGKAGEIRLEEGHIKTTNVKIEER